MKRIDELTDISPSDNQLLADLKEIVLRFVPDAELLLYGSTARGSREPDSDYDVLVLMKGPLSREKEAAVNAAIYDLQLDREAVLSTFFYTRDEWNLPIRTASPFYRNVEREGILL